jgi:hypothetical protein
MTSLFKYERFRAICKFSQKHIGFYLSTKKTVNRREGDKHVEAIRIWTLYSRVEVKLKKAKYKCHYN